MVYIDVTADISRFSYITYFWYTSDVFNDGILSISDKVGISGFSFVTFIFRIFLSLNVMEVLYDIDTSLYMQLYNNALQCFVLFLLLYFSYVNILCKIFIFGIFLFFLMAAFPICFLWYYKQIIIQ